MWCRDAPLAARAPPRRRVGAHAAEDSATPKRVQKGSTKSTAKRVKKLCSCVSRVSSSKRKSDFFALVAARIALGAVPDHSMWSPSLSE